MTTLKKALRLGDRGVISLVGAGGKTSLMFRIAAELSLAGESVLTTTTTRILMPEPDQSQHVLLAIESKALIDEAAALLKEYPHLTAAAARIRSDREKLAGFTPDFIDEIRRADLFRWIVVEADGAARKPLKAPAPHEPVIPGCTQRLIGIIGLKCIGKPLTDQWVFRPELYGALTGIPPGAPVTAVSVATAILDRNGIMKGGPAGAEKSVFLNLADEPHRLNSAREIAGLLRSHTGQPPIRRVVIGRALDDPAVVEVYDG